MKKLIFLLSVLTATLSCVKAQVKIGNNANTINANSILELESTNKGFLPPRVALTSVNSPSPLSAPIPTGMIVYSSAGSVTDGAYMWNGSKWQNFGTDISKRSNYVLVKSSADFPAPVSGIITLVSGTLYEINGTILISDKINLNGCEIKGGEPVNDKIIYLGSGEMFTGAKGGGLTGLSLTSPSGKVFNINAAYAADISLVIKNCYFLGCNTVGTLQGITGFVYFGNCGFYANTNGITFQNNRYVFINGSVWDSSNSNTYEKFIGAFEVIQILGGDRLVTSANSATALNITGITSLTSGSIKVVMFVGNGVVVSGTFSNAWEVETSGLNTEKDDVSTGNLYITTPVNTIISSTGVPVKVSGTTTGVNLFRVSSTVNNRLTYTGAKLKTFQVICSLTATQVSTNKYFSFYIAKNGVVLPQSRQAVKIINSTDQGPVTLSCTVPLSPGDYVEVWVENETSSTDLTVQTMNLAIK